jgi:hypothetical protein
MSTSTRYTLGTVLGVLALLGPLSASGQAQAFRPGPAPINPARLILNPYVNPFMASALVGPQNVLAAAGFTHPLAAMAGAGWGWNSGLRYGAAYGMNSGYNMGYGNGLGYGSLANSYGGGSPASSLYTNLMSGAVTGASYGYGYGLGMVQWMMNPYQGYLQGVADITRSQGEYARIIQQSRLQREEVRRSALQTRHAMLEEAEWERAHAPDAEKIRQRELVRELDHARVSPPLPEIWSARSPNVLLNHLIARQGEGAKGPRVALDEDTLKQINLTSGDTRGSVGLLKEGSNLEWPTALKKEAFKPYREEINSLMKTASRDLHAGKNPAASTLNDLLDNLGKMRKTLESNLNRLSNDHYIEAKRYLDSINDTISALKEPNVAEVFKQDWLRDTRDVATLVKNMREKGLVFAPATPNSGEAAYVALYHALLEFDAGLPRVASNSQSNRDNR